MIAPKKTNFPIGADQPTSYIYRPVDLCTSRSHSPCHLEQLCPIVLVQPIAGWLAVHKHRGASDWSLEHGESFARSYQNSLRNSPASSVFGCFLGDLSLFLFHWLEINPSLDVTRFSMFFIMSWRVLSLHLFVWRCTVTWEC